MLPPLSTIQERRKRLNWTQRELAERSGVSQSAIAKIERGLMVPSYQVAAKLFQALEEGEREANREKTAADIMSRDIITLCPKDEVSRARELMKRYGISQIPVMEENKVLGMLTETDILEAYERYGSRVSEYPVERIMGPAPLFVRASTPITAIVELLRTEQALLVMEKGKPVGIITRADVIYKGL